MVCRKTEKANGNKTTNNKTKPMDLLADQRMTRARTRGTTPVHEGKYPTSRKRPREAVVHPFKDHRASSASSSDVDEQKVWTKRICTTEAEMSPSLSKNLEEATRSTQESTDTDPTNASKRQVEPSAADAEADRNAKDAQQEVNWRSDEIVATVHRQRQRREEEAQKSLALLQRLVRELRTRVAICGEIVPGATRRLDAIENLFIDQQELHPTKPLALSALLEHVQERLLAFLARGHCSSTLANVSERKERSESSASCASNATNTSHDSNSSDICEIPVASLDASNNANKIAMDHSIDDGIDLTAEHREQDEPVQQDEQQQEQNQQLEHPVQCRVNVSQLVKQHLQSLLSEQGKRRKDSWSSNDVSTPRTDDDASEEMDDDNEKAPAELPVETVTEKDITSNVLEATNKLPASEPKSSCMENPHGSTELDSSGVFIPFVLRTIQSVSSNQCVTAVCGRLMSELKHINPYYYLQPVEFCQNPSGKRRGGLKRLINALPDDYCERLVTQINLNVRSFDATIGLLEKSHMQSLSRKKVNTTMRKLHLVAMQLHCLVCYLCVKRRRRVQTDWDLVVNALNISFVEKRLNKYKTRLDLPLPSQSSLVGSELVRDSLEFCPELFVFVKQQHGGNVESMMNAKTLKINDSDVALLDQRVRETTTSSLLGRCLLEEDESKLMTNRVFFTTMHDQLQNLVQLWRKVQDGKQLEGMTVKRLVAFKSQMKQVIVTVLEDHNKYLLFQWSQPAIAAKRETSSSAAIVNTSRTVNTGDTSS